MKKMIHKISSLICLFIFLGASQINASHVLGHEITYTCVSANQYNVQLVVYADCSGIASANTATVNINSASCSNNFNVTLNLDAGYPLEVTPICATGISSCNGGSIIGINKYVYSTVVSIPSACSDWQLSWSNCCRPGSISNISNPFSNSLYAYAELDNTLSTCNNSPSFVDAIPRFIGCANDTNYINFGATDTDGDSLIYSLAPSANGVGSVVTYNAPLTAQNPFTGSTSIDAETGLVILIPSAVQVGVIVVKVEEYRNGVKVGEILRDVTVNIYNCSNNAPIITAVNGLYQNGAVIPISANEGTAFSTTVTTYDLEVAVGTQTLITNWSNLPTGATVTTGASPTLNWTPTASDVGTHYIYLTLTDDACPLMAQNTYSFIINVAGISYQTNNDVITNIAVGSTTGICLDISGITTVGSISLVADGFDNATINSYDLVNGCMNIKADSIATDNVTFLICDNVTNDCVYNTVVLIIEPGVWPGDTDTTQHVDNFDLLNIGLAYGNTGTARNTASIVWDGYLTPDWTKVTPVSNINFKHMDCNGDGIINMQDTVAISNNWNASYSYNKSSAGTIPLYIQPITPNTNNASLPIMFGDASITANDIYGIAFTISYDTSLVEPNTIDIAIDASWLGTAGTDLIKIHKDFYIDGMVQIAITRTDGVDIDGFGQIASLIFTIQDDIMQRDVLKFPFEISNVKTINANEVEILTNPMQTELNVISTNTNQLDLSQLVHVFPNPTSNVLNIQSEDLTIEQITLTNIAGQVIETKMINNYQTELYMQNLPNGIYTLSIMTNKGLIHKKVNLLK